MQLELEVEYGLTLSLRVEVALEVDFEVDFEVEAGLELVLFSVSLSGGVVVEACHDSEAIAIEVIHSRSKE